MSASFENKVVRASAGSGKTFKLSERFLKLLLAGEPLDSILATTFTRKAAGEIQARILARLGAGALTLEGAENLRKELCADDESFASYLGATTQETQTILQNALREVVNNLHRLRVSTLDSFFIQISGGYAYELGLPPNWRIVDESEDSRLLRLALLTSFSRADVKAALELSRALFKGEYNRSIENQIRDLVRYSLKIFHDAPSQAWTRIDSEITDSYDLQSLLAQLTEARQELEEEIENKTCDSRLCANIDQFYETVVRENWKEALGNTAIRNGVYYKKPVPQKIVKVGRQIQAYAREQIFKDVSRYLRAVWATLDVVSNSFTELKREQGAYVFDDLTRLLATLGLENRLSRIVYRLNAKTRHVLLDEFQDASLDQWKIIRSFALNAVSQNADEDAEQTNGSFYCVGDGKQAIYGWRGGDARIFDAIENDLKNVVADSLTTNWRSCPTIIDVVNRLFENILNNPAFNLPSVSTTVRDSVKRWNERFETHKVAPKNESLLGYWALEQAPRVDENGLIPLDLTPIDAESLDANAINVEKQSVDDEFDVNAESANKDAENNKGVEKRKNLQKNATLHYVAERVYQLRKRYPAASIGILPRTNDYISLLVRKLKERFRNEDVEISED